MSKAIIKSNLGQGKYLVDVELDNRKGAALYQDIQSQISATELAISIKQSEYQTELDKYNYLASLINVSDTIEAQQKAIADARKQQLSMQQASRQLNLLKTKLNQLIIKIGQITPDETLKFECYGWSADSQEDISVGAVVGILDRDRENWQHSFVTIKPSYDGASNTGHLWVEADDGNFTKSDGMSAANYAYSYALVEAADKWKPHYGHATISSINGSNYTLSNGETGTATFRDCSTLPYEVGDSVVYDSNFNIVGYQNQFAECGVPQTICNSSSTQKIYTLDFTDHMNKIHIAASETYLAVSISTSPYRIELYHINTGDLHSIINVSIYASDIAINDTHVAVSEIYGTTDSVNVYNIDSGNLTYSIPKSGSSLFGISIAMNNSYIVVSDYNANPAIYIYDVTNGNLLHTVNKIDNSYALGYKIDIDENFISAGAPYVSSSSYSGYVHFFDITGDVASGDVPLLYTRTGTGIVTSSNNSCYTHMASLSYGSLPNNNPIIRIRDIITGTYTPHTYSRPSSDIYWWGKEVALSSNYLAIAYLHYSENSTSINIYKSI